MTDSATILVVDDDADIRTLVLWILQRAGFCVQLARNGAEALTCVAEITSDLVVTDLLMPRLEGADLMDRLRAAGYAGPVIFMSARDAPSPRPEAPLVRKPFERAELRTIVSDSLDC